MFFIFLQSGYVQTPYGQLMIEPVEGHGPNEDGHLLHMIHKINKRQISNFCGTTQWESGWKDAWNYHHKSLRVKRSEVKERFMEVMVVADKSFIDYHKNDDPERYIMTIMNIVSDNFHDESTGQPVNVVIVRVIQLEEENSDLKITSDGPETMDSFCSWQQQQNPKEDHHPQHHDVAILLTRRDLCMDGSCSLLGLASVAGVCVPHRSCAINEDTGLDLGVVVTHEVGHLMGCNHDSNECLADENKFNRIMAPSIKVPSFQWSKCSQKFMQELFDSKLGECLNDEPPESPYKLDDSVLPGAIYGSDYQCQIVFGNDSKVCHWKTEEICGSLWCQDGDKCRSKGNIAADGTTCGHDKWCIKKECVRIGKRNDDAVAGGWSDWGEWSNCSAECGGGVKFSERNCTNPLPKNGGKFCMGERKRYEICNVSPCPPKTPSHRQLQCSAFNDKNHQWKEHFVSSKSCVLICSNGKNKLHEKAKRVKDGTFCKPGTNDMCIAGECKVG